MGGEVKQTLTDMEVPDHQQLHRDLNDQLVEITDDAGNHMRPQRGNPGSRIRDNFTRQERLEALADFYKRFGDEYPDAAADFFRQHPNLE